MNSISRTITLILFILANDCLSQKVTNIVAEQVGQSIQVSYNLETESPCTISLFYSTDNGSSWQGPLKKVSGDVGEKIYSGNKKITWDVLNEMEQLKFSSVVFKVDARKIGLKEIKIGNQIWSAENLNTDRFANGELIPEAKSNEAWVEVGKNQKAAWCYYHNDSLIGTAYGKLYNWYAVADLRGLCPTGWHVPAKLEWDALEKYLGGSKVAGGKLKEQGTIHWASPNIGASNEFSFSGVPGNSREFGGGFFGEFHFFSSWWSSSINSESYFDPYYFTVINYFTRLDQSIGRKGDGNSVRCIKD